MQSEGKKRIVVKVGSSSLASPHGGCDFAKMKLLVEALSLLKNEGHEVLLVSSGAVASGYTLLGYQQRPRTLVAKQAAAAIGQSVLMQSYASLFAEHHYNVAQILLTRSDFSDKERYHHAFETISLLLSRGIVPIINENDPVSVAELTFGDNDMLGALVSGLVHADLYTIITDTDGLYDKDPRKHKDAVRIPYLAEITAEAEAAAGDAGSLGTGGMRSKIIAAKTAQNLGISTFIGRATRPDSLLEIAAGRGEGTYVSGKNENLPTRKQWIALHSPVKGQIFIDEGAAHALTRDRRSLLIGGVRDVAGDFQPGEVVEVFCGSQPLGRGVSRYGAEVLRLALSPQQGVRLENEVIHRDQWVLVP
ncbi:glutamate 5-kinase [Brevibacillus fulvus]|uniref:Glutamate 5-kinase n=1 Tax=Brevibacillus fulvus TaxID=1125967 RepID=A0A938XVR8_9BACL|nr:glutamate 5-kinase [Brevibacillus fulvus]MBM7591052.1 glutamate 5-kinase [Brevibacillus fulvus]